MVKDTAGFTLLEIVIVLAISSLLGAIAWAGQSQLRARAQFDASINKMVASIADARNEAVAGVNVNGSGDGSGNAGCNGIPLQTVFAGTAWTTGATGVTLDFYKTDAANLNKTCVFQSNSVGLDFPGIVPTVATSLMFVKTANSGLTVCEAPAAADLRPTFLGGDCDAASGAVQLGTTGATTPLKLMFSDSSGHSSEVDVDGSGLAKRIN